MQNKIFIQTLQALVPGAGFRSETGTYDDLEWFGPGDKPTLEEYNAKYAEVEAAFAMNEMRVIRDAKLTECDWVVAKATETGTAVPTEWATYRQALRDLTTTAEPIIGELGEVTNVTWPTKPV